MPAVRNGLIGLVLVMLCQGSAAASPIQVSLFGSVDGHSVNTSVTLSDPSQPLVIPHFADRFLVPSVGPDGYYGGGTIDSSISLEVSVVGTPGSPPSGATVRITGDVHGSWKVESYMLPNMDGSVSSAVSSASLIVWPGWSRSDVPPYLADLVNHPERVGYSGSIIGMGSASVLTTTLTIAPPVDPNAVVPAPEPSMLAIALMGLAGLSIARRLRASHRE